jgi:hypothetical protein
MKLNIARLAALGPIGLGVLFTALGGCAAGAGEPGTGSSEPVGKVSQATITPISINPTGACTAVGTFNIVSPQTISFIAANASSFKNMQMQVFEQDNTGTLHQVNTQQQAASASFNAMLVQAASASASNEAHLHQTTNNAASSSATTSATAQEQDQTVIGGSQSATSQSDTQVTHHDDHTAAASGTATNTVFNQNSAANSANGMNGANNTATQTFLNTAMQTSLVPAFFGGIVTIPSSTSSNNSGSNNTTSGASSFFNNAAAAAATALATQTSSFSNGSSSMNNTFDEVAQQAQSGSMFSQTLQHQLQAQNGTSVVNTAGNSTDLRSDANNAAAQSSGSTLQQSGSNSSGSAAQVVNDLQTFNQTHFQLQVNLTVEQANSILQLFQGSNGVVTNTQNFPVVLPSCIN